LKQTQALPLPGDSDGSSGRRPAVRENNQLPRV